MGASWGPVRSYELDKEWAALVRRRKRAAKEHGLHCEPRHTHPPPEYAWALFVETASWSRSGIAQGTGVSLFVQPVDLTRARIAWTENVTVRWYDLSLIVPGRQVKLLFPVSSFKSACFWAREVLPAEAAAYRLGAAG